MDIQNMQVLALLSRTAGLLCLFFLLKDNKTSNMYVSPIMSDTALWKFIIVFLFSFNLQEKKKEEEWKHKAASGLARNRAKIQTGKAALSLCYL